MIQNLETDSCCMKKAANVCGVLRYCSENGENWFLELGANEVKFIKSVANFAQPSTGYSHADLLQAH
jgi:hypothetical protein